MHRITWHANNYLQYSLRRNVLNLNGWFECLTFGRVVCPTWMHLKGLTNVGGINLRVGEIAETLICSDKLFVACLSRRYGFTATRLHSWRDSWSSSFSKFLQFCLFNKALHRIGIWLHSVKDFTHIQCFRKLQPKSIIGATPKNCQKERGRCNSNRPWLPICKYAYIKSKGSTISRFTHHLYWATMAAGPPA